MFNKKKQFHHDSLFMHDIYIVMINAYDVNNSHSFQQYGLPEILPLLSRIDAVPRDL
jgi:hypothetical protein